MCLTWTRIHFLTLSPSFSIFTPAPLGWQWNHVIAIVDWPFLIKTITQDKISSSVVLDVDVGNVEHFLHENLFHVCSHLRRNFLPLLLFDDCMRLCAFLTLFLIRTLSTNRRSTKKRARACVLLLSLVFIGASLSLFCSRCRSASIFWYSVNVIAFSSSWASDRASTLR